MSTPSTFRLIVLGSQEQTTIDDASLSSDQPLSREAATGCASVTVARRTEWRLNIHVNIGFGSASVFQENKHLFLRDKITLRSLANMNDHKKHGF